MLRNYIKIAWRTLARKKAYAFINIFGLALGIACCILIATYVQHERSYDQFHDEADRLYRVVQDVSWGEGSTWTQTAPRMGEEMVRDLSSVEQMGRITYGSGLIAYEQDGTLVQHQEEGFALADPGFFELFNFPLIRGDARTALRRMGTAVLTESTARKYFGDTDPIGQTLRLDNQVDLTVTGVVADLPTNTHVDFDLVASFETLKRTYNTSTFTSWWWPNVYTYVRVSEGANIEQLNQEWLPAFIKERREARYADAIVPRLQAVPDIHLYDNPGDNAIRYVYIFTVIAVVVLLVACINYINLATARAAERAREVGVRQALGANRRQLIGQFYGESVCAVGIAFGLGLIGARLLLPVFNDLAGRSLTLDLGAGWFWLVVIGIAVVVGAIAGSYPALYLSAFEPTRVLRGRLSGASGAPKLRKGLVVFQFVISITLIAATLVVYSQVQYMRGKNLGFDTEQVVAVQVRSDAVAQGYETFKGTLLQNADVLHVTHTNWYPGVGGGVQWSFSLEGMPEEVEAQSPLIVYTDPDFFETLGMDVKKGRALSASLSTDTSSAFILNETAVATYQVEEPVGRRMRLYGEENGRTVYEKKGVVVGVVEDFHIDALREPIRPLTITGRNHPREGSYMLARIAPGRVEATLQRMEAQWNEQFPDRPFEPSFIDEQVEQLYEQEVQFGKAVGAFSGLAVLIACLGLFGLAAFSAQQRTKEIGIRKALGASVSNIIALLSKDFVVLVGVAFALATPVAYVLTQRWLEGFAYRFSPGVGLFAIAGIASLLIALATVSYQAYRAAQADPTQALQSE